MCGQRMERMVVVAFGSRVLSLDESKSRGHESS